MSAQPGRRRFLKVLGVAGGALVVGVPLAEAADSDAAPPVPLAYLGDVLSGLGNYVRIDADGTVLIGARDPDTGTGAATALTRIIADELDADWNRVTVINLGLGVANSNGKPRWIYGRQLGGVGGSVPAAWADLRQAGALARWLLTQAAAKQLNVQRAQLRCSGGRVIAPDGRQLDYGSLAKAAAAIKPPAQPVPLKTPDRYTLIGTGVGDAQARAIVTGEQRFALDERRGDALVAVIAHCPWSDGSLAGMDKTAAMKLDGVVDVVLIKPEASQLRGRTPIAPGVAVVARNTWAALEGRKLLKLEWKAGAGKDESSADLEHRAGALVAFPARLSGKQAEAAEPTPPTARVRNDGDVDGAGKKAARRIEATYFQPWLAHATAEPMNCLVHLATDRATLVIPTQAPQDAWAVVQRLTKLKPGQIDIQVPRVGGGYGRRLDQDFVAEAVLIAQAVKQPVRLLWTREDELAHDYYRAGTVHAMRAIIGAKRELLAWDQRLASASALVNRGVPDTQLWTSELSPNQLPAGLVPNFRSDWYALGAATPRGPMRAQPDVHNAFAAESFIDEIAHTMREDPLKTRLRVIGDPQLLPLQGGGTLDTGRLINVLNLVAERIEWKNWLRTVNGLGIACWFIDDAYVAHAIEVSKQGDKLTIERVVVAADVGRVINPTGLEGQLAGATLAALSDALGAAITIKGGQVQQKSWHEYGLASVAQLPNAVETIVVADNDRPPTGASLIALPTAAPALANAVFRVSAVRVRRLPLLPEWRRML